MSQKKWVDSSNKTTELLNAKCGGSQENELEFNNKKENTFKRNPNWLYVSEFTFLQNEKKQNQVCTVLSRHIIWVQRVVIVSESHLHAFYFGQTATLGQLPALWFAWSRFVPRKVCTCEHHHLVECVCSDLVRKQRVDAVTSSWSLSPLQDTLGRGRGYSSSSDSLLVCLICKSWCFSAQRWPQSQPGAAQLKNSRADGVWL